MAYLSLADFKRDQGIPDADTTHDAQLQDFLDRAQAIIDNHCHRTFEATANTTRYIADPRAIRDRELWLDRDLAAINSITNGDGTVVDASQYVVIPTNAIVDGKPIEAIRLKTSAPIRWDLGEDGGIAISGKWAYSVTPPEDVVQAMFRLTQYLFQQKDNAADIDKQVLITSGGNTHILPPRLPDDLKKLLVRYVRTVVTS